MPTLSQGMHYLNTSYANYFVAKHKTTGPLFQGRYKSLLIDADHHALTLSCYIHLNPRRTGTTKSIDEYPWSSLPDYLGQRKKKLKPLNIQFILARLDINLTRSHTLCKGYILENLTLPFP